MTYQFGRVTDFQDNLRMSIQTGDFERDFPDGYHKEMIKAEVTGTPPNQAILDKYLYNDHE